MISNKSIGDKFLKALDSANTGGITVTTPEGRKEVFGDGSAEMIVNDWRAIKLLAKSGDVGMAEGYMNGLWESKNPADLFAFGLNNEDDLKKFIFGGFIGRITAKILYLLRVNTKAGSKKNIHAHYDLGNSFYKLWLDETMTYSSALYNGQDCLKSGQLNKYDNIINNINQSGDLLEIGCGWGGFAERALVKNDYNIKGITLSNEQLKFSEQRVKDAEFVIQDYRDQKGKFDNIVSIEMFEAVGERYWKTYFDKVSNLLSKNGKAVVQTITIDEKHFQDYRKGGDAIRTYIFPGGMLPSPERFENLANKSGLKVADKQAFGQDYAKTLNQWNQNFMAKIPEVKALGFDNKFIKLWEFYLTSCEAAFRVERTDVMQLQLEHA